LLNQHRTQLNAHRLANMIPMTNKYTDPTGAPETTEERPVKPANVIHEMLRTYAERGTSVANIMATGAMFGFNDNQMRVGLSRLVAKQTSAGAFIA
jgi:hypothetical protein